MPPRLRFGRFELRPGERRLVADGQPVNLGPRAFNLLLCLVENRDRVVPKRELLEAVWPGVAVDEGNLTVQASALRKLLGSDAIVTIAGQGYRFALPVAGVDEETEPGSPLPAAAPTLAVLPFETPDGDTRLRLMADALAEDVIALLARLPGLVVIAHESSALFAQSTAADAAGQLGVRYVAEGSLSGHELLSMTAHVTDAATGFVLWTGRLQASASHIEDLHVELARNIAGPLRPQQPLVGDPVVRRRTRHHEAGSHYRSAAALLAHGGWSDPVLAQALTWLQLAGDADPAFAQARAHRALLQAIGGRLGHFRAPQAVQTAATAAARQAAADDPGSPQVLALAAGTLAAFGDWDAAVPLANRSLAVDPSNALAYAVLGVHLCEQGQVDAGRDRLHCALRLSPRDRQLAFWVWEAGTALARAGRPDVALEEATSAARQDPHLGPAWLLDAALLQRLAREDEAVVALQRARHLQPGLTPEDVSRLHGADMGKALEPLWERATE